MSALRTLRVKSALSALVILTAGTTASATAANTRAGDRNCDPWAFCVRASDDGEDWDASGAAASGPPAAGRGRLGGRAWSVGDISGDTWCLYSHPRHQDGITEILGGHVGNLEQWVRERGVRSLRSC
ncbi:hypothetical protein AB0395_13815 [Streptosporangium sp. NPDC051023]|uniref:hypothetical protein n=1 Tax=Streptosporangium sp. NPDC051023 TaxID=3155410 RepID=UPI00344B0D55